MQILSIIGTRPEAIKMAPVVKAIAASRVLNGQVLVTGQHAELLQGPLSLFGIAPDENLKVMRPGQGLNPLFSSLVTGVDAFLEQHPVDAVLVHGDTTTAAAAALAAFHRRIPVGHVEAGLRTNDLDHPFPEEMNRRLIDTVASALFVPTTRARDAAGASVCVGQEILITGNTVVDALLETSAMLERDAPAASALATRFAMLNGRRLVLVTGHRRENFGEGIAELCAAIRAIAEDDSVALVYPVHPNPNVLGPVRAAIGDLANVFLIDPLDYLDFVYLMNRADLIITDSGGIQEEAPSLGVPVLVTRKVTERPEALSTGRVCLVGANASTIVPAAREWLTRGKAGLSRDNPYGDGLAAQRIVAYYEALAAKKA